MDFVIGALAAMGATFFSNPINVLKTRMQLQGELKPRGQHAIHYKNVYDAAKTIAKNEGYMAFQKGLPGALIVQGVRNGFKLGTYQYLTNRGYICDNQNQLIFFRSLSAAALGGGLGAFFGTPFFRVTTQMQAKAAQKIAVGFQHDHPGLLQALKAIYRGHGVIGLWRGGCAITVRSIVGASSQLTIFSYSKEILRSDIVDVRGIFSKSTFLTAFVASTFSGVAQVMFQSPFDLVVTRLNNQHYDKKGKGFLYDGMIDCFVKILRHEGYRGLYKGVGAYYIKTGRHTTFSLVFWEILKDLYARYSGRDEVNECRESLHDLTKLGD